MKNTGKYITTIILTLGVATSFARIDYTESTSATSDLSDSYGIMVDYPAMSGVVSTTKGNVVLTVDEGVSVTTERLNVYGTDSAIIFKGNNQVNVEQISIFGGAGTTGSYIQVNNKSTVNTTSIYLRDGNTKLIVKDSTVIATGNLNLSSGSEVIIDNSILTVDSFSQIGIYTKETSANIKVQNGGKFTLDGEGYSAAEQGHNIYIDASSTFTSTAQDAFYGTLTLEEGAEVSFAENTTTKFDNLTLIFDNGFVSNDILDMADFKGVTVGGETVVLSQLSENVIVQNNIGEQYEITFDETTGAYSVGNYVGSVPEPSTYAAIFGALALGFVIYRRRK